MLLSLNQNVSERGLQVELLHGDLVRVRTQPTEGFSSMLLQVWELTSLQTHTFKFSCFPKFPQSSIRTMTNHLWLQKPFYT